MLATPLATAAITGAGLLATAGLVMSLSRPRFSNLVAGHEIGDTAMALACALVAAVILSRRPGHPVGRLFAVIGLSDGVSMATSGLLDVAARHSALWTTAVWLSAWTWVPGLVLTLFGICLVVPDGLSGLHIRWLWRFDVALLVAVCVCQAFQPRLQSGPHSSIVNPVEVPGAAAAGLVVHLVGLLSAVGSIAVLVVRVKRAGEQLRRQLLPIVAAAVLVLVFVAIDGLLDTVGTILQDCSLLLIPGAAMLSVLRLRLYDLEIAIGRTAAWATLSALLVAVYVAVVELASSVLNVHSRAASAVATVVIAVVKDGGAAEQRPSSQGPRRLDIA